MRRIFAAIASALFLVIAPGTVAGLVPWWITRWRFGTLALAWLPVQLLGGLLALAGALVLLDSFARFALQGLGTPAPIFPTRHLVVGGLYRYVRNPMYLAVLSMIAGQGMIFGSLRLLEYAALVWLCFHLFVVGYEEPALRAAFGAGYDGYCAGVRRWIPRLNP